MAAIEADFADYAKENPADAHMVAARKATFADKWPHEGKKGWKCKTKQVRLPVLARCPQAPHLTFP